MANLSLKEMGKFLREGREKYFPSWLPQFSFANKTETANREDLFPYLPKGIFLFPSNLR